MKRTMNEKWVPYTLLAKLVKIDRNGETDIKIDEVGSYEQAFRMLEDYILDATDMDDFIKEEYAAFAAGEDERGRKQRIGWLQKNGQTHERSLRGRYDIELRVYEDDPGPDDTEIEDYYTESKEVGFRLRGAVDVVENPEDSRMVDVVCVCPWCGAENVVTMNKVYWNIGGKRYDAGDLIQTAFPKLGKDEREMLKTGICNDCWNGLKEVEEV